MDEKPFVPRVHFERSDGVLCCIHTIPVGADSCDLCLELHVVEMAEEILRGEP